MRHGTSPDAMNQSHQVYEGRWAVSVASLNVGIGYFAPGVVVNNSGITPWAGEAVAIRKIARKRQILNQAAALSHRSTKRGGSAWPDHGS